MRGLDEEREVPPIMVVGVSPPCTGFKKFILPEFEIGNIKSVFDPVTKPQHYNRKGIECIQAIEASMNTEQFRGYLKGNCVKYIWRKDYKGNPVEDLKKAKWYLEKLIDSHETKDSEK